MGDARTRVWRSTGTKRRHAPTGSSYARRLRVEELEDRRMLATLTVTTLADDATNPPTGSLRAAIAAANATEEPDAVVFDAGLTGAILLKAQLPTISKELTITGPGAELLALDAGGGATAATGDGYRIFNIDDVFSRFINVTIEGLTLAGGDPHASDLSGRGGAIRNWENLTINECTISGNTTTGANGQGGGIYSAGTGGKLLVLASTISGNSTSGSDADGGGIFARNLVISDSTISGNSTSGNLAAGGGIYCSGHDGIGVIAGSTISGNSTAGANAHGGGIYFRSGSFSVNSTTISGNIAGGTNSRGGGIYSRVSSQRVVGSTISGNSAVGASGDGGGVWILRGNFSLVGSTVSGNSASGRGGGLFNEQGSIVIESSTITVNTAATGQGGGVGSFGAGNARTEVRSSIIAGNPGGDVAVIGGTTNTFQTSGANLIGSGNSFGSEQHALDAFSSALGDQTNVADAMLGPLADNGGQTKTHALLPGSPAVDRGDAAVFNIAQVGLAAQSSEYRFSLSAQYPAHNAIDNSYATYTHTNAADSMATWQVNLGEVYPISQIVLHNRQGYGSRLRDITVSILDANEAVVFTSDLLNPENILGAMTVNVGPAMLTIDLKALTGGAVVGRTVRVSRTPDPDLSGSGGAGNEDEPNVLSLVEVEVFTNVDQRGLPREVNGQADVGAYESQDVASADFDSDGFVDGQDFLAWQRGVGISAPHAVKSDGDADGDLDVDADDLAVWRDMFGSDETGSIGRATTAAAESVFSPVAESKTAAALAPSSADLVDAVLAVQWIVAAHDEPKASRALREPSSEAAFAFHQATRLAVPWSAASDVMERGPSGRRAEIEDASEEPSLADELLENVFA